MRVLFIVYTYYQLLTAIQLRRTVYKSSAADVVVADSPNGYQEVAGRLAGTDLFANVYTADCSQLHRLSSFGDKARAVCDIARNNKQRAVECCSSETLVANEYDLFAFFNYHYFTVALYSAIKERCPSIQSVRFEEGFTSYFDEYQYLTKPASLYLCCSKLFGRPNLVDDLQAMYCYSPELVMFEPKNYPVIRIPALNLHDEDLRHAINSIFDIDHEFDFGGKVIFFEEAFFEDGLCVGDDDLILKLSQYIGPDRFLLKPHPRNRTNRFEGSGIQICPGGNVPWEVFLMNADMRDAWFLTVTSGSVLSPRLLFDFRPNTAMLYKCTRGKSPVVNENFVSFVNRLAQEDETLYLPNDIEELLALLARA